MATKPPVAPRSALKSTKPYGVVVQTFNPAQHMGNVKEQRVDTDARHPNTQQWTNRAQSWGPLMGSDLTSGSEKG